ncbi:MAG TPA: ABC transporter permease subunit [Verrucomicrobiae bacterium]|nr:ABC transporter permease subunit [Verrucomicrobiae bacterium]
MTFLPIVERELRVAARSNLARRGRIMTAIMGSVFVVWMIFMFNQTGMARFGGGIFASTAGTVALYCLFAGFGSTIDSISREKRDGTIGLLFLTDLTGWDVVLGKLMSSTLAIFYGVLAATPALSVTLLLGGVEADEFLRTALALLNTLFFASAAGLLISTWVKDGRKIMGLFGGVFWIIFWNGASFPARFHPKGILADILWALHWFNPLSALGLAHSPTWRVAGPQFWTTLLVNHVLGWGLLAVASWWLPRRWQEKGSTPGQARRRDLWRNWTLGNAEQRVAFRRRSLAINPIFWLMSRSRLAPLMAWFNMVLFPVLLGGMWFIPGFTKSPVGAVLVIGGIVSFINYMWLRASLFGHATRQLMDQRVNGAMELLASAPLSVAEILRGQWLGLRRVYAGPLVAALLVEAAVCLGGYRWTSELPNTWTREGWVTVWVIVMVLFVLDMIALGWAGLLNGMTAAPNRQRKGAVAALVMAVPWLATVLINGILSAKLGVTLDFFQGVLLWAGIGVCIDILVIVRSRRRLRNDFRVMAAERFQTEETTAAGEAWWQRVWARLRVKPASVAKAEN